MGKGPIEGEGRRASYRYPWPVANVEELRVEIARAAYYHGRTGLCAWRCEWLDPPRTVRWGEALKLAGMSSGEE